MFSVWAPNAAKVSLFIGNSVLPMQSSGRGCFSTDYPAEAGSRYGFILEAGNPLPDPRSPSQPDGVHGLSEVIDHSAFSWSDDGWQPPALKNGIIYELHVGTFSPEGTFQGVIRRLPYLKDLGLTHI